MFNLKIRAYLTFISILAAFGVNVASNFAPLNGQTVGELSNTVFKDVLLTPANYAFAIWGLIYIGVFAFGIYQLLPNQRKDIAIDRLRPWMILASWAQVVWIVVFLLRQYWVSLIAMVIIWGALMRGYFLWRQMIQHPTLGSGAGLRLSPRWSVQYPWSLYLGWISVATIVNVALTLYAEDWSGFGIDPRFLTLGILFIIMLVAMVVMRNQQDYVFVGVFIWALVAIAVRHWALFPLLGRASLSAALVLVAWSTWIGFRSRGLLKTRGVIKKGVQ